MNLMNLIVFWPEPVQHLFKAYYTFPTYPTCQFWATFRSFYLLFMPSSYRDQLSTQNHIVFSPEPVQHHFKAN